MAVVASLDENLDHRLKPLADEMYTLDHEQRSPRGLSDSTTRDSAEVALQTLLTRATKLYEDLPVRMAGAMQGIGARP